MMIYSGFIVDLPIENDDLMGFIGLPSGKRLHNYGKSPLLMGKSTISMAMFNSYVTNYQRVHIVPHTHDFFIPPWALKTLNPISKIDIK